ncbi:hypothetical protein C3Y87_17475 [Carbonactinospora thermoautotrophica]|uniref:hypothetical protein n=1 Tax=Carbonactinospora thermoautotrophica TaxID=1469144 RepID=UPI002271E4DD|nr:hypothetical protein [Carbonactinospora thermoautotrophica]MCX9193161.1 hypothetical protein [Carbonactinospora thermoautotrophica]
MTLDAEVILLRTTAARLRQAAEEAPGERWDVQLSEDTTRAHLIAYHQASPAVPVFLTCDCVDPA